MVERGMARLGVPANFVLAGRAAGLKYDEHQNTKHRKSYGTAGPKMARASPHFGYHTQYNITEESKSIVFT